MRNIIAGSLLALLSTTMVGINAQDNTWIAPESGAKISFSYIQQGNEVFIANSFYNSGAGIMLWHQLGRGFMFGSGFALDQIYEGYNVSDKRQGAARYLGTNYQVPFRFAFRSQFGESPVFLWTRFGSLLCFTGDAITSSGGSGLISDNNGNVISYTYNTTPFEYNLTQKLEAGFTLGVLLGNNWELGLNMIYQGGISKLSQTDITYSGSLNGDAIIINRGNSLLLTTTLMVPVSNIWINRDFRIRKKIENSIYSGKSTDQSNSIYFGGNIASLWRSFSTTNAALTARPVNNKGIFRYANLSAGGYVGYMLTANFGMDIGGYYQRSNLLLSATYDQENNTAIKEAAPMFLEIPLRLKYLYNLYKQQFFFTASGGASMLLQFAGTAYTSGSAAIQYPNVSGGTDNGTMNYTGNRLSMFGGLLRFSAGLEYRFRIRFPLVVTAEVAYGHGLAPIDQTVVSTSVPEVPEISMITYNGTGWRADLGIKIPVKLGQKGKSKCGSLPRIR